MLPDEWFPKAKAADGVLVGTGLKGVQLSSALQIFAWKLMGFCVHVYFLFQLGKLQVIQEHPVIKYVKQRLGNR